MILNKGSFLLRNEWNIFKPSMTQIATLQKRSQMLSQMSDHHLFLADWKILHQKNLKVTLNNTAK